MQIFSKLFYKFILFISLACTSALGPYQIMAQTQNTVEFSSTLEAFRNGFIAYRVGDKQTAINALGYAAEHGFSLAQWKLGHMYATGDGVEVDAVRAFQFFYDVANRNAEISPNSLEAPFVANAFVELGKYLERGIPNTHIVQDQYQARQVYTYAAAYFGNPYAQYYLARMYLEGRGGRKNIRHAARWYKLAAEKGHVLAQAELGRMLFFGEGLRQSRPEQGLKWIIIAFRSAKDTELKQIQILHSQAWNLATPSMRDKAIRGAEVWIQNNTKTLDKEETSPLLVTIDKILNNKNYYSVSVDTDDNKTESAWPADSSSNDSGIEPLQ